MPDNVTAAMSFIGGCLGCRHARQNHRGRVTTRPGRQAIDDDGNQITTTTPAKRGRWQSPTSAVTAWWCRPTAHLKSKLLTFPGRDPDHPQFDARHEAVRARFGLEPLINGPPRPPPSGPGAAAADAVAQRGGHGDLHPVEQVRQRRVGPRGGRQQVSAPINPPDRSGELTG
jgi:hypothetical protein